MSLVVQLPKGGLVRSHDKPIHGSCATYFSGGIYPVCMYVEGSVLWRSERDNFQKENIFHVNQIISSTFQSGCRP